MIRTLTNTTSLVFHMTMMIMTIIINQSHAFLIPVSTPFSSTVKLLATTNEDDNGNGNGKGLVAMGNSLQSQLASAFSALDESDQYDAVLTGLCAKILDQPSLSGDEVIVALQDSISLLEEMNLRKVSAGSRSLMALVDVSTSYYKFYKASIALLIAHILILDRNNFYRIFWSQSNTTDPYC
jgi:hypothetical protein